MSESETSFLRKTADSTRHFSPIILRGSLWVGIAMLQDFRHSIQEFLKRMAAGDTALNAIGAMDWLDAVIGLALAGMIAWRIFLDQSVARFHDEKKTPAL